MKTVIYSIFIFLGFTIFLKGCGIPSCGPESKAVVYAKSISESRLEQLYSQMKYYYNKKNTPYGGWINHGKQKPHVPIEFRDLDIARIRPRDSNIMVEGCLDEYVYMNFINLDSDTAPKQIEINYPSHSGGAYATKTEILWQEK
jgi:hypothetical protein